MDHLVANPIHVYSVIYRIINKLPPVIAALQDCEMKEEVELVRQNILEAGEVTEADLVGAMQSLLRIQFTYRSISQLYFIIMYLLSFFSFQTSLDPVDLSSGLIGNHQTKARLSLRKGSHGTVIIDKGG